MNKWTTLFDKVKAAALMAIGLGLLALVDNLTAIDLGFLGSWALPVGALLATGVAYARSEITGYFLKG